MTTMIEDLHNVANRDGPPVKKRKIDDQSTPMNVVSGQGDGGFKAFINDQLGEGGPVEAPSPSQSTDEFEGFGQSSDHQPITNAAETSVEGTVPITAAPPADAAAVVDLTAGM